MTENKKQLKETERILKRLHQKGDITVEAYAILNDRNKQAINYTDSCAKLKTFDIHKCINEVSEQAQRRSFVVYDLKEDKSFRYGVKTAIDKMLYNK